MKTQLLIFVFLAFVELNYAHMSLQFPVPRNKRANGQDYLVWEQNEPMVPNHPQVCHGLPKASVPSQNVFQAGQTISIQLGGSVPHGGGHCAFWYALNEGGTWYKITDMIDCTLKTGNIRVTLPKNIDQGCANNCIFTWSWQPLWSGGCEVYSNCADIRVTGGTGGYRGPTISGSSLISSPCVRINEQTRIGTMFGATQFARILTSNGVEDTSDEKGVELCLNPNAPKSSTGGRLPLAPPSSKKCMVSDGIPTGYGCDDGQCCSQYGYCGPIPAGVDVNTGLPYYIEFTGNSSYNSTFEQSLHLYCDNNQGDWRMVTCRNTNAAYPQNAEPTFVLILFVSFVAFFLRN